MDGKPVETSRALSTIVAGLPVGKKTDITLIRDGSEKTVNVKLDKRKDDEVQANRNSSSKGEGDFGLSLSAP